MKLLRTRTSRSPDASSRTPQEVSSLLSRFRDQVDPLRGHQRPVLRRRRPRAAARRGKKGCGAPFNIGAGDGDPSAFQRINSRQFQAATVPEPLAQQGWQIVDEFNRAFSGQPASGYIAPGPHRDGRPTATAPRTWDPPGYREAYRKIWNR